MGARTAAAVAGGLVVTLLGFLLVVAGAGFPDQPAAGGCAVAATTATPSGPGSAGRTGPQKQATLGADQMAVARTIIGVGKGLGVSPRGTAIALGTAMQESTLAPTARSGQSVGIYQQQGEFYADVDKTDPAAAAAAFYRMLLRRVPTYGLDPARGGPTFADAAQTVQASGAGASFYASWESWATALSAQLYSGTPASASASAAAQVACAPGAGRGPVAVDGRGLTVVLPPGAGITGRLGFLSPAAATAAAAALSYLGTPYVWGGGGTDGPSRGLGVPGVGFDCSGLTQYAYAQAGIALPRVSRDQQNLAQRLPWSQAQPGDLLFYGQPAHHVALYLGQIDGTDYMAEAPTTGSVVKVSRVRTGGDFTATVVRPQPPAAAKT